MKKIFRILVFMGAMLPLAFVTQSFNMTEALLPAPNYTMVEIEDCPSVYAIRVDLDGTYEDPNLIIYSPSGTEVFNAAENHLYYYSEYDVTYAYVFIKQYSYSSWTSVGYMHTNNPDVTLTLGGSYLQKMTFDYDEIQTS